MWKIKPELLTIVYDRKRATGKKSHAISFHLAGPGRSIVRWSDLWPAGVRRSGSIISIVFTKNIILHGKEVKIQIIFTLTSSLSGKSIRVRIRI